MMGPPGAVPEGGLTIEEVDRFHRDGFVTPVEILDQEEAHAAYAGFLRYEAALGGCVQDTWRFKSHLLLPWMACLVRHPRATAAVKAALGTEDILCWSSDIFAKEPGDMKFTGWHQDSTYVCFSDPPDVLTLWLALTPSTSDSGCVSFWPMSHLRGQLPHTETTAAGSLLLKGQELAVDVPEAEGVPAALLPGQASLHHIKTVHRSGLNQSSGRRVGIAIRYMAATVQQNLRVKDSVTVISGSCTGGYKLEPRPAEEMDKAALTAHRVAVGPVYPEGVYPVNDTAP